MQACRCRTARMAGDECTQHVPDSDALANGDDHYDRFVGRPQAPMRHRHHAAAGYHAREAHHAVARGPDGGTGRGAEIHPAMARAVACCRRVEAASHGQLAVQWCVPAGRCRDDAGNPAGRFHRLGHRPG
jgi:hypothetical protein